MNKIDLISIPAYEFYADEKLVNEVYDTILKTEFVENTKNHISKNDFYDENLFSWFNTCLKQVKDIYYSDDLDLVITSCWANKTNMLQQHQAHYHINSIVSGVFYLDDSNSELEFQYNDPWLKLHNDKILGIGKAPEKSIDYFVIKSNIKPQRGRLILFPSTMMHGTQIHKSMKPRYTISFNTFVSGKLNPDYISAKLTLSTNKIER